MKYERVIVAEADMQRLERMVASLKHSLFRDQHQIDLLEHTLQIAEVRNEGLVPRTFVKMKSCVRVLDIETEQKHWYTLVYPEASDISRGLISILAPVGIALLGHKKGDVVTAKVPGGLKKLKIERVLSDHKASDVHRHGRVRHLVGCGGTAAA